LIVVAAYRAGRPQGSLAAGAATAGAIATPAAAQNKTAPPVDGLASAEARGKRIYEDGIGPEGRPILAVVGNQGGEVPAAILRCANCHGEDGRGTSEAGVDSPDITWSSLSKPHRRTLPPVAPTSRARPPYSDVLLKRAISLGIDSAGNALLPPMPHYQMTMSEMNDLLAYLKRLGQPPVVPGVAPDLVRLGALLPPKDQLPSLNQSVRAVLVACADRVNQAGGIYGRRIELDFLDLADDAQRRPRQLERWLVEREPFALVWSFVAGAEIELTEVLRTRSVPTIGAFTSFPHVEMPPNRFVFYLDGGARSELMRAITHAAAGQPHGHRRLAVLVAEGREFRDLSEAVALAARKAGFGAAQQQPLPARDRSDLLAALARELAGRSVDVLCMIAPPERWVPLLEAARSLSWQPQVLVPGSLTTSRVFDVSPEYDDRLVVAFSAPPSPSASLADASAVTFSPEYPLSGDDAHAQRLAFASTAIIAEALKRAGRDVTRDKMVTTLEQLRRFPTGAIPPVSFGPNQRIGVIGAYLTRLRRSSRTFAALSRLAPEE
jgi:ABC-type branched-subunit amino acid transport system substrate-binding protein